MSISARATSSSVSSNYKRKTHNNHIVLFPMHHNDAPAQHRQFTIMRDSSAQIVSATKPNNLAKLRCIIVRPRAGSEQVFALGTGTTLVLYNVHDMLQTFLSFVIIEHSHCAYFVKIIIVCKHICLI
jgi:hypothetical protein